MHSPDLPPVTLETFGEPDLDDRIAHILRMRSGMMGEAASLQYIGDELGVGRERIRQLENEGLALIRKLREVQRHRLQIPPPRRGGGRGYVWNRLRA
jgi:DNA-directed RNA polymerase sigma subunit (sigma70/sigma32)